MGSSLKQTLSQTSAVLGGVFMPTAGFFLCFTSALSPEWHTTNKILCVVGVALILAPFVVAVVCFPRIEAMGLRGFTRISALVLFVALMIVCMGSVYLAYLLGPIHYEGLPIWRIGEPKKVKEVRELLEQGYTITAKGPDGSKRWVKPSHIRHYHDDDILTVVVPSLADGGSADSYGAEIYKWTWNKSFTIRRSLLILPCLGGAVASGWIMSRLAKM